MARLHFKICLQLKHASFQLRWSLFGSRSASVARAWRCGLRLLPAVWDPGTTFARSLWAHTMPPGRRRKQCRATWGCRRQQQGSWWACRAPAAAHVLASGASQHQPDWTAWGMHVPASHAWASQTVHATRSHMIPAWFCTCWLDRTQQIMSACCMPGGHTPRRAAPTAAQSTR